MNLRINSPSNSRRKYFRKPSLIEVEAKTFRDNPIVDRLIEVVTKTLRCGLMSGETLRAPRQQLRRPRTSVFDFFPISSVTARFVGARFIFSRLTSASSASIMQKFVFNVRKNFF